MYRAISLSVIIASAAFAFIAFLMSSSRAFTLPKHIFNASLYKRLQSVWFQDIDSTAPTKQQTARWFGLGDPSTKGAFDRTCVENFRPALEAIGPRSYPLPTFTSYQDDRKFALLIAKPFLPEMTAPQQNDTESAGNALSLILLLDQLSRNVFRNDQNLIYTHYDRIARSLLHTLLNQEYGPRPDLHPQYRYSVTHRMWFYMPLMHSEFLEDHDLYLKLMEDLMQDLKSRGDEAAIAAAGRSLDSEKKHRDIIERFGRYPHRNAALGRDHTEEERKFLTEGGATFGTSG